MKVYLTIYIVLLALSASSQKQLEKLHSGINSLKYDELGPILSIDNSRLYFTRTGDPDFIKVIANENLDTISKKSDLQEIFSQISGSSVIDPGKSDFNQDIYFARLTGTNVGSVEHPGYPLNNAYPNSVLANFEAENALVVLNIFDEEGGITKGFSKVPLEKDGSFGFPEGIEVYEFNNMGNEVSMTMSPDAEQLFIAMERPDSKGETDIYLCIRVRNNVWSKPEPVNSPINTIFRETAPFLSKDKRKLYFSSNRPGSHGGMDIYVADRLDYTYRNWSEPRLLPIPINSAFDDSQPYLDNSEDYLYFSSKRDGTSDIYRYHLSTNSELQKPLTVSIRILDAETMEPVRGEIFWGRAHEMGFERFFRTYSGSYEVTLRDNELMKFKVIKRGFVGDQVTIDPLEIINDDVTKYQLDLLVRSENKKPSNFAELPYPFGKKRKITLRNIYFQRSESKVLPQSFEELEKLVQVLKDFPDLRIRVAGHSDNIGDKQLLIELSEDRAIAIKTFLVEKGIEPQRIETVGFGDAYPLNDNATETERKRNRRVEILVISE